MIKGVLDVQEGSKSLALTYEVMDYKHFELYMLSKS